jgi:hypothetical protein
MLEIDIFETCTCGDPEECLDCIENHRCTRIAMTNAIDINFIIQMDKRISDLENRFGILDPDELTRRK